MEQEYEERGHVLGKGLGGQRWVLKNGQDGEK